MDARMRICSCSERYDAIQIDYLHRDALCITARPATRAFDSSVCSLVQRPVARGAALMTFVLLLLFSSAVVIHIAVCTKIIATIAWTRCPQLTEAACAVRAKSFAEEERINDTETAK